ncbi:AAA family ATPase [Poriferisphaera sp. WC338]|uniref:ParA family protein n=1 Tax=Poriferisphaera sp. WC338 TaxID=3425129 RepID=UPI003D8172A3
MTEENHHSQENNAAAVPPPRFMIQSTQAAAAELETVVTEDQPEESSAVAASEQDVSVKPTSSSTSISTENIQLEVESSSTTTWHIPTVSEPQEEVSQAEQVKIPVEVELLEEINPQEIDVIPLPSNHEVDEVAPEALLEVVSEDTPIDEKIVSEEPRVALAEPTVEEIIEDVTATEPVEPPMPSAEIEVPKVEHLPAPRIIALMNQKGGVGKTTTAVNLGAALGRQGYRVLLLDLDPQAHLTLYLGIDPESLEASMYDLLADDDMSAEDIRQVVPNYHHLHVLPAEVNLAGVESELADKVVTGAAQSVLRTKVSTIADQYDFILLDCPPSLGLLTINALTLAREVIVPMQAHFLALQGLGKLLETIAMLRQGFNPNLLVAGIVLCMHEKQTILAGEVIGDLEAFLEQGKETNEPWSQATIFSPPIRRNIKLAESPSFGQSIFDYDASCNGAQDYLQLAKAVASHTLDYSKV